MDFLFSAIKRNVFNYMLGILAVLTFGLAFVGWWELYPDLPVDQRGEIQSRTLFSLNLSVRAFLGSDLYAEYMAGYVSAKLEWAGFIGILITLTGIIYNLLVQVILPIEKYLAASRKGHAVVLGESDIAVNCSASLSDHKKVTLHSDQASLSDSDILVVPRPLDLRARFIGNSINNANRIIIAESDDSKTAQTASEVCGLTSAPYIFAVLKSPWIAAHLRQSHRPYKGSDDRGDQLIPVSEVRALARTAIVSVPPFLLAAKNRHKRVHVVFFGFNDLTLAMIEEILFSNVYPGQALPRFTVLTPQAFAAEASFNARYPGFVAETGRSDRGPVDVNFIECVGSGLSQSAIEELKGLTDIDPVTICYVTLDDELGPFAATLAVQKTARQTDLFDCPIFMQSRQGNGLPPVAWNDDFVPCGIYSFGAWDDLSMALGVLDDAPDQLAKAYHESYRSVVLKDLGANGRWELLPEAFRVANRHAVLHLPAKLAALGFDITPYLSQTDALSPSTAPMIAGDETLVLSADAREALAVLEHERWMMERWITGWRYAPERDNDKMYHPNLLPYDQLNEATKDFDRLFVDWLEAWISRSDEFGISRSAKTSAE